MTIRCLGFNRQLHMRWLRLRSATLKNLLEKEFFSYNLKQIPFLFLFSNYIKLHPSIEFSSCFGFIGSYGFGRTFARVVQTPFFNAFAE